MIINTKPEKAPPRPLRDWILAEVKKVGDHGGLILPDGAEGSYALHAVEAGPDVEGVSPGDEVVCHIAHAMSRSVRISDRYLLLPSDLVIGVYPRAK